MTDNASLPFELSTESLGGWINSLSALPAANAANQLNLVLKQLNRYNAAAAILPILINLTPLTLHLSNGLTNVARSETDIAANGKALKIAKLAIQLLRHLSLAFCRTVETKQLDPTQNQQAIFYALQLIGYCLRSTALFYEMPSTTLWKKSGLLFTTAGELQLLKKQISSKQQEFKLQNTIEEVVKRNLLFAVSTPNRYPTTEINQLFQLANRQQNRLEISKNPSPDCGFFWNLGSEPSPVPRTNCTLPRGSVYISCLNLGHALQLGEIETELNSNMQTKLALHLTGYSNIFASVAIGPPMPAHLLEGFIAVSAHLQGEEKLSKIMNLSSQLSRGRSLARDMSLVPLEHEKSFYKPLNSTIVSFPEHGTSLSLLRNVSKQFLVAESPAPNCSTGDIGLLCREQQPAKLVIVRQQTLYEDVTLILLEPIIGSVAIHDIENAGDSSQKAIVIGMETDHPEVLLTNGKYTVGSKISLLYGKTLYLKACVENTPWLVRFRVGFDL
ncbi:MULTISPECIES: hypothetical protein [Methylomonas]|uniref:GTPase n=2 Tax=Methylomonas TaxID=416 RepID=A0A126T7A9_9GAMM|nr:MULTISPECIES: hypothetical protein [Methylomonas]AMK77967.1 hypothetical protein JT25_016020 [Methylomonas denitrificans]OAI07729.1 hypothetical protein A1342_10620 [Methylomonas methanica]TCV85501.1 hypothetical protein EDE11_10560 [Methylomonas methanica]